MSIGTGVFSFESTTLLSHNCMEILRGSGVAWGALLDKITTYNQLAASRRPGKSGNLSAFSKYKSPIDMLLLFKNVVLTL